MAKLLVTDVPLAIESILRAVRDGCKNTFNDQVVLSLLPDAVEFDFEIIIRKDGVLDDFTKKRYSSFDSGIGKKIEAGTATFAECEKLMIEKGDSAPNESGRQEYLENVINHYI